jgi:UDP-sugar transporter A1/2/3
VFGCFKGTGDANPLIFEIRSLSMQKWIALGILTIGVAIVQFPTSSTKSDKSSDAGSQFLGLCAVLIACTLSGLAGVWFEKVHR